MHKRIFFFVLLAALLLTRLVIYLRYNLQVIDTDQPYMWMGAADFAKGFFPETRYYGQDYNTFMEALFASPLVRAGMPVFYAVPLATHLIALCPFVLTATYLYRRREPAASCMVLAIPLCLPPEYDLLNALPRGFVTGLFFCSVMIASFRKPQNLRWTAINTAAAVIGFFVNPNSLVVSAPVLFFIFLHNTREKKYYLTTALVLFVAFPCYLFFDKPYRDHPEWIQNPMEFGYSAKNFIDNITSLDMRFTHVSFFTEYNSLPLLAALALLALALFRSHRKGFYSFLVLPAVLLAGFFLDKTTEGTPWVFNSYSRLYLGIPLVMGLFASLVRFPPTRYAIAVIALPLVFTVYKLNTPDRALEWHFRPQNATGVRLMSLPETLEHIAFYKRKCEINQARFLLVSHHFWLANALAYGGPAIHKDFPETQETRLEKRHWIREANADRVVERLILVSKRWDIYNELKNRTEFRVQKLDDYGIVFVTNNTLPIGALAGLVEVLEVDH